MPTAVLDRFDATREAQLQFAGMLTSVYSDDVSLPNAILPGKRELVAVREPCPNLVTTATDHYLDAERRVEQPIRLKPPSVLQRRFTVLQQWEGVVLSVEGETISAEIRDLTEPTNPVEIVEFDQSEVSPEDSPFVSVGSVFYWSVGHETKLGGQITRMSEIRVKRGPRWTRSDIAAMHKSAEMLYERMKADDAKNGCTTRESN